MDPGRHFTIAILVASAALLGGGQALAPAPALAMVDNGAAVCPVLGASWFDQVMCLGLREDDGGGDEETRGCDGETHGCEVILVRDPKCGDPQVICVPVGGSGSPGASKDHDIRVVDQPARGGRPSGGKRAPREPFEDPQQMRERDERACLHYSRNFQRLSEAVERLVNEHKWGKSEEVLSEDRVEYILDLAKEEWDIQSKKWIDRRCRRFWA
jgi:hypothetical protein